MRINHIQEKSVQANDIAISDISKPVILFITVTSDEKHGDICKQSSDSVSITDADETDQSSAMSLLLNELLSMNQLRARKKRERNILVSVNREFFLRLKHNNIFGVARNFCCC